MAVVSIRELVVEYSSGGYAARPFDHFDLELESGELVVLLGASGCGKSTLLSILGSLLAPTAGSVQIDGQEITHLGGKDLIEYRRHTVGFVFQGFNLIPSLSARENVEMPMLAAGEGKQAARTRAEELLALVDLTNRSHHKPGAMSGGQQQRVAIARAIAMSPKLVLADEPTASLDYVQVDGVLRHLRDLAAPGRTVVIATHDERLLPLADRVVELTPKADRAAGRQPERIELAVGQELFRHGDAGELVYEVESGAIVITRELAGGGEEILQVVEPGGYFGELAPMFGLQRAASARGGDVPTVVTGYTLRDFRGRQSAGL